MNEKMGMENEREGVRTSFLRCSVMGSSGVLVVDSSGIEGQLVSYLHAVMSSENF